MKKQELIDAVYDRLTDENYIISNLAAYNEHEEHLNFVYGSKSVSESIRTLGLAKIGMYFLYDIGDGNVESVMPEEIKRVIDNIEDDKIKSLQKRYCEVFNYLRACINFYGIVEAEFFCKIFSEQHPEQKELLLKELMYYLEKYNIHNSEIVYYDGMLVSDSLCMYEGDIDKVLDGRQDKEYCILSKEELLKYSNEYYIKKTKYYDDLEKYLIKHFKDKEVVKGIIADISIECVMDIFNLQGLINRLQMMGMKIKDLNEVQKLISLCIEFGNNTHKWINKGWTPAELLEKETGKEGNNSTVVISHKVGRNEPCPCGSGKKYKKCCGR